MVPELSVESVWTEEEEKPPQNESESVKGKDRGFVSLIFFVWTCLKSLWSKKGKRKIWRAHPGMSVSVSIRPGGQEAEDVCNGWVLLLQCRVLQLSQCSVRFGAGEAVPARTQEHSRSDVRAQWSPVPVLCLDLCLSVFSWALRSEIDSLKDSQGGFATLNR